MFELLRKMASFLLNGVGEVVIVFSGVGVIVCGKNVGDCVVLSFGDRYSAAGDSGSVMARATKWT